MRHGARARAAAGRSRDAVLLDREAEQPPAAPLPAQAAAKAAAVLGTVAAASQKHGAKCHELNPAAAAAAAATAKRQQARKAMAKAAESDAQPTGGERETAEFNTRLKAINGLVCNTERNVPSIIII